MKVKDLPIPLQKLVILRTRTQPDDSKLYSRYKSLSDKEILKADVSNLFDWGSAPDNKAIARFWSNVNNNKDTDRNIVYAKSIVGNIVIEPLLHF